MTQDMILTKTGRDTRPAKVKVWDLFVRTFHWSLVGLVVFAFLTAEDLTKAHIITGYAVLALIGSRILWGFVGTKHARFSDFVYGPKAVAAYLRDLKRFKAPRMLGHNPLGGIMVLALLVALTVTGITGYLAIRNPAEDDWLEEIHEAAANGTLLLIALHVAGVVFSSLAEGENLIRAMITGRKRAPQAGGLHPSTGSE